MRELIVEKTNVSQVDLELVLFQQQVGSKLISVSKVMDALSRGTDGTYLYRNSPPTRY